MKARTKLLGHVDRAVESGARLGRACRAIGISIRTVQRWRKNPGDDGRLTNRFARNNALSNRERRAVIRTACSPEFRDLTPHQIVPILAEKGRYLASPSTFYRLLKKEGLLKHRSESRPPSRARPPGLTATAPNQVWSWDITYLRASGKGRYFFLYVVMDIWDRSIVGWDVRDVQSGEYASALLKSACSENQIAPNRLTIHQDNGAPMISNEFHLALEEHRVAWTYSRPGVCDDNAYSEALFKTVKYRAGYPRIFHSLEHAQTWATDFVVWYNNRHRHSGINYVTPLQRRTGKDIEILKAREATYRAAMEAHPERWSGKPRSWSHVHSVSLNARKTKKSGTLKAA